MNAQQQSNAEYAIDPMGHRGILAGLELPYTVFRTKPFNLLTHLKEINCTYSRSGEETAPKTVDVRSQQASWLHCSRSARALADREGNTKRQRNDTGWTLSISSLTSFAYSESVAAQLAAQYLLAQRLVLWVNLSADLYSERDLRKFTKGHELGNLDAVIVTGLRWDGTPHRFDKAFDLLRQTHEHTDRIIVGSGADPLSMTRALDLPVHRAINVMPVTKTTRM